MISEVVDVFKGQLLDAKVEVKAYPEVTQVVEKLSNVEGRNQILLLDTGDTLDAARLEHILRKAARGDPSQNSLSVVVPQLRVFLFDKTCMDERPERIFQNRFVRKPPHFTISEIPRFVALETESNSAMAEQAGWYFKTEKESLNILMDAKKKYEDVKNTFLQSKELMSTFRHFASGKKVTVDNLMLHYIVSYRKVEKFNSNYKNYLQKYDEIMDSFDSDVDHLRTFDVDRSLSEKKISDFIDFEKLTQWRKNCEDSHQRIDNRVRLIYQTLEDVKKRVSYQEENSNISLPEELEKDAQAIERIIEKEFKTSLQMVLNSYLGIRKNLERCIESDFGSEDVSGLKSSKEEFDSNSYSRYVMISSDLIERVTNWKLRMEKLNKWTIKELFETLKNVAVLETDIKFKVKKKTEFMMDILSQQSKSLRYVQLPRMFPIAYKNAVQELERRAGFKNDFKRVLAKIQEMTKLESEKRAIFLGQYGDFIPQDFCPELKEPPPALQIQNCQFSADHELITENVFLKRKTEELESKYQELLKSRNEYEISHQKLEGEYKNKFNQWKMEFENKLLTASTYGDEKRSDSGIGCESSPLKISEEIGDDQKYFSEFSTEAGKAQDEVSRIREIEMFAREEIRALELRRDATLEELAELKSSIQNLQEDHKSHNDTRSKLQQELDSTKEEMAGLAKASAKCEEDKRSLGDSLTLLREAVEKLQEEEKVLKERAQKIEELRISHQNELTIERTLTDQLETRRAHAMVLRQDFENLKKQIDEIDTEKAEKEQQLKEMQNRASTLEISRSEHERELKRLEDFEDSLREMKADANQRICKIEEDMSDEERIVSAILKEHKEETDQLRQENTQLKGQLSDFEEQYAILHTKQHAGIEIELKGKEEEIRLLKGQLQSMEDFSSPEREEAFKFCITELTESQKMIEKSAKGFDFELVHKPCRESLEDLVRDTRNHFQKLQIEKMLSELLSALIERDHEKSQLLQEKTNIEDQLLAGTADLLQEFGLEASEDDKVEKRLEIVKRQSLKYKNMCRRLHDRLEARVAVREIEDGDLVLFFSTRKNTFVAYNIDRRVYFLDSSVAKECQKCSVVLVKVTKIVESMSTEQNCKEFDLDAGEKLTLVHADILHRSQGGDDPILPALLELTAHLPLYLFWE